MSKTKVYLDRCVLAKMQKDFSLLEKMKKIAKDNRFHYVISAIHLEEAASVFTRSFKLYNKNQNDKNCISENYLDYIKNDLAFYEDLSGGKILRPLSYNKEFRELELSLDNYLEMIKAKINETDAAIDNDESKKDIFYANSENSSFDVITKNYDMPKIYQKVKELEPKSFFEDETVSNIWQIFFKEYQKKYLSKEGEFYSFNSFDFFTQVEIVSDFLQFIKYYKDKIPSDEKSCKRHNNIRSRMYDTGHVIYSSYCDYFVSDDIKLVKRAKVIFQKIGGKTPSVIELESFINRYE